MPEIQLPRPDQNQTRPEQTPYTQARSPKNYSMGTKLKAKQNSKTLKNVHLPVVHCQAHQHHQHQHRCYLLMIILMMMIECIHLRAAIHIEILLLASLAFPVGVQLFNKRLATSFVAENNLTELRSSRRGALLGRC